MDSISRSVTQVCDNAKENKKVIKQDFASLIKDKINHGCTVQIWNLCRWLRNLYWNRSRENVRSRSVLDAITRLFYLLIINMANDHTRVLKIVFKSYKTL